MLGIIAILSITMALTKFKRLNYINSYIKSFEETFWSGISLDDFYKKNSENLNHPLGMIFKSVYEEWLANDKLKTQIGSKADIKERMLNVANVQKISVLKTCERYLDTLSLFVYITPFLGLLGTIIGIIDVFYTLDIENGLTILSAGAGIGGSLISVALSMCVVLISMFFYWWFNLKMRDVNDKLDGFIVDLLNILGRGLDGTATQGPSVDNSISGASQIVENINQENIDSILDNEIETNNTTKAVSSSADDDI